MLFKRPASYAPLGRARPQPRRGTFALEPVQALPRLAERIGRLADRALEPNPFFLPEFLEPALRALGGKGLRLATFADREDLRFFAPVAMTRRGWFTGAKLAVWTHPYAPLGTPLIDGDFATPVCESIMRQLRTSGRALFSVPQLPLSGPVARTMKAAAGQRGFWTEAAIQQRPVLVPRAEDDASAFDRMVAVKRRKELERQLRRLCDRGAVSVMSARGPSEIEAAFATFIALEASGWKGRRGTALQRGQAVHDFARIAVMQMAHRGLAAIDIMRAGDRPVAGLIRFDHGGLSVPWKISYDEEFAGYSPGKQLICDETRRWLGDSTVNRVDPICEEDNPLLSGLWPEREPYGTLLLTPRPWGIGARLKAGSLNLRSAGKRHAKTLLGRRPRPARPAAPKPAAKPARPKKRNRR